MKHRLVILKFGSSVLSTRARLPAVVHEIYRRYRQGCRVVAVVSAIGNHTDSLLAEAQSISKLAAPERALAQLLSTGELRSAALLTLSLHRAGIPCELLDATTAGLVLGGDRLDAVPIALDTDAVRIKFASSPVLVLAGFTGLHEIDGMALMGRGGSDLSAVFLADQLAADECRLVKDVDGIYEHDPAAHENEPLCEQPHRYGAVTYEDALRVAEVLVQPKVTEYLQAMGNIAWVSALLHADGTEVGAAATTIADPVQCRPLKVLLLGLGVVGRGVYQHLKNLPEFFEIVGIHVRDVDKHTEHGVSRQLLARDIDVLTTRAHDLVVDVSGDWAMASAVIDQSLRAACSAVTASKQLVADKGAALIAMASSTNSSFKYSAAVGGSAPMVEAVQRAAGLGGVIRLRGVLNGTCNFVLDRIAAGATLEGAVKEAQALGFAEANVARDLSGQDTTDKLRILARIAFGATPDESSILQKGLETVMSDDFKLARTRGQVIRLVATYAPGGAASVKPELLPGDDYLAGAKREENRLIISGSGGRVAHVSGKGAGRWPTAEAVVADMLDVYAMRVAAAERPLLHEPTAEFLAQELLPMPLAIRGYP